MRAEWPEDGSGKREAWQVKNFEMNELPNVTSFLNPTILKAIGSVVILLVVAFVGIRVAAHLRGATNKDHTSVEDLVRNFEEMRRQGDMSDAEFRTITSVLGKKQTEEPERSGPTTT